MKIGMITDSLGHLGFDKMLKASAELGLETLEFACGNWSSAPHMKLDKMLESEKARKEFKPRSRITAWRSRRSTAPAISWHPATMARSMTRSFARPSSSPS